MIPSAAQHTNNIHDATVSSQIFLSLFKASKRSDGYVSGRTMGAFGRTLRETYKDHLHNSKGTRASQQRSQIIALGGILYQQIRLVLGHGCVSFIAAGGGNRKAVGLGMVGIRTT